jgi:hypothetical protein
MKPCPTKCLVGILNYTVKFTTVVKQSKGNKKSGSAKQQQGEDEKKARLISVSNFGR